MKFIQDQKNYSKIISSAYLFKKCAIQAAIKSIFKAHFFKLRVDMQCSYNVQTTASLGSYQCDEKLFVGRSRIKQTIDRAQPILLRAHLRYVVWENHIRALQIERTISTATWIAILCPTVFFVNAQRSEEPIKTKFFRTNDLKLKANYYNDLFSIGRSLQYWHKICFHILQILIIVYQDYVRKIV